HHVLCISPVRGDAGVDVKRVRQPWPELTATRLSSRARGAASARRAAYRLHGPVRWQESPAPLPRPLPGAGRGGWGLAGQAAAPLLIGTVADLARTKPELIAENAFLRQQLIVLRRQVGHPRCTPADRALLVLLASRLRTWRHALLLVQPDTLLRWHRQLFRWHWRRTSRATSPAHRPPLPPATIALIREMAAANRLWGAERIRGERLKLDIRGAKSTTQRYRPDSQPPRRSSQPLA